MIDIPLARKEKLIVQDLSDEILIYDELGHRISHLNRHDAFIWRLCDGRTPTAALLRLLEKEFGAGCSEEFLSVALQRLDKLSLLQRPAPKRARAHVA